MEQRKLISFGRSSYVLSLPQLWVKKHNLEKGNNLSIEELNEGLLIFPGEIKRKNADNEIVIKTENKNIDIIRREIASAYIRGYNTFIISGFDVKDKADNISKFIQYLMALEIVEQSSNKIVAKDFLNIKEVSLESFIRKIDVILRSMFQDLKISDRSIIKNIIKRDEDVNRLTFLVQRAVKIAIKEPAIAKQLGENPESLLQYWRIATHLERTGDVLKAIATTLLDKKIDPKLQKTAESFFDEIEKQYLMIAKAYHEKDEKMAINATQMKNDIIEKGDKLMQKIKDPSFLLIVDKMKYLAFQVNHFARIVYI
ncbi:MAG: phosphate uptake regulator PhoU [Candidatus Woesearchaeota archaeon]